MEKDEATDPVGVDVLGAQRQAAHAATVTDLIERLGFIGFSGEIAGGVIRSEPRNTENHVSPARVDRTEKHPQGRRTNKPSHDRDQLIFHCKAYPYGGDWRRMALSAEEFLRRFLQHVLPAGFVRIGAFGFLANRHRAEKLTLIGRLLGASELAAELAVEPIVDDRPCCPHCAEPALRLLGETARPSIQRLVESTYPATILDSS